MTQIGIITRAEVEKIENGFVLFLRIIFSDNKAWEHMFDFDNKFIINKLFEITDASRFISDMVKKPVRIDTINDDVETIKHLINDSLILKI